MTKQELIDMWELNYRLLQQVDCNTEHEIYSNEGSEATLKQCIIDLKELLDD